MDTTKQAASSSTPQKRPALALGAGSVVLSSSTAWRTAGLSVHRAGSGGYRPAHRLLHGRLARKYGGDDFGKIFDPMRDLLRGGLCAVRRPERGSDIAGKRVPMPVDVRAVLLARDHDTVRAVGFAARVVLAARQQNTGRLAVGGGAGAAVPVHRRARTTDCGRRHWATLAWTCWVFLLLATASVYSIASTRVDPVERCAVGPNGAAAGERRTPGYRNARASTIIAGRGCVPPASVATPSARCSPLLQPAAVMPRCLEAHGWPFPT